MSDHKREYWKKTQVITFVIAALGMGITFGTMFFASSLKSITFFGWDFPFYMGSQGNLLLYVALVFMYQKYMDKIEKEYWQKEQKSQGESNINWDEKDNQEGDE